MARAVGRVGASPAAKLGHEYDRQLVRPGHLPAAQDPVHFRLPEGIDLPAVIGEFHFGALDRGMFHPGLRPTADQQARAAAYRSYVHGAMRNPCLVGTHWFQYGDQATTGRGDGENYQIGLVDVCDTPYPEIIAACREVGYAMYRLRWDEKH